MYNKAKILAEEPLHCSTGGDGRVVPDEELGEDLVAHESTVAQVFFLRRTFQPSTHQLCGICFEDTARRTRGCRCEAIKPISTLNFLRI